jgi:hypothetical protein
MPYQADHARLVAVAGLGLTDPAATEQVTAAYRRVANASQPDVNGRTEPDAEIGFAEVSEAYQRLVSSAERPTPQSQAGHRTPRHLSHLRVPRCTAAGPAPLRRQPLMAGPVVITPLADTPRAGSRRTR